MTSCGDTHGGCRAGRRDGAAAAVAGALKRRAEDDLPRLKEHWTLSVLRRLSVSLRHRFQRLFPSA